MKVCMKTWLHPGQGIETWRVKWNEYKQDAQLPRAQKTIAKVQQRRETNRQRSICCGTQLEHECTRVVFHAITCNAATTFFYHTWVYLDQAKPLYNHTKAPSAQGGTPHQMRASQ